MTARSPIPPDAFASALASLDTPTFAALVGETYAASADAVDVDAPRVTVVNGDQQTELVVVATGSEGVHGVEPDVVAVASESLLEGVPRDAEVVTPADLRRRLLYAVSLAEANAIADRFLDAPIRSAAYDQVTATDAAEDTDEADGNEVDDAGAVGGDDAGAVAGDDAGDQQGSKAMTGPTSSGASDALGTAAGAAPRVRDDADTAATGLSAAEARPSEELDERKRSRALIAVVVAVALVAAAAVGAASVGDGLTIGGGDDVAGVDGGEATDGPSTEPAAADRDDESGDESDTTGSGGDGAGTADGPTGGDSDGKAARNTGVTPTCDRSALQVVQLQMNALRFNNETTNDGIRAARAFSSPTNRRAVGSVDQFISLFESPSYAPMLTYDTAQYSVPDIDNETAEVDVVTRENGSVTGRYEFRLERVPGGSAGTSDDLGDVDDCWMTRAVGASTE